MKRIRINKPTAIVFVLLTVAIAGLSFYLARKNNNSVMSPVATNNTTDDINKPPTEEEKAQADAHKSELIERQELENNPTSGQKQVTPVITSANQNGQEIFVSSYVPGIFEDGGTCTFTFNKDAQTFTKVTNGFANVSKTDCANLTVVSSEFTESGTWNVTVSYTSSSAKGTSQSKQFIVE